LIGFIWIIGGIVRVKKPNFLSKWSFAAKRKSLSEYEKHNKRWGWFFIVAGLCLNLAAIFSFHKVEQECATECKEMLDKGELAIGLNFETCQKTICNCEKVFTFGCLFEGKTSKNN